ncbi:MAG: sulfatase-like hydrolase/transferase [Bacteroidota bacterium]
MNYFLRTKKKNLLLLFTICTLFGTNSATAQTNPTQPNILLIVADDLGVDATNGYQNSAMLPNTPHLDSLRTAGLTFLNAWATPKCTPTRATIMSGKYGIKTGVQRSPGNLDASHTSIFSALATQTSNAYADAVIGKWHISQPVDYNHPSELGIDYYSGSFQAQVADYYNWEKVHNDGSTSTETTYATTDITDEAINWVNAQSQPWFLWLAHVAPHSPFHAPPAALHTSTPTNTNRQKYIAMIEAMDYEIGRLFDNVSSNVLANTIIIFIGDNGTPGGVLQNYPSGHGKSTLYQGGVHVPLFISGPGVSRTNEQESSLVHATDLYATILEMAGGNLAGGINNSHSFQHLLSETTGSKRNHNYSELEDDWTIRNEQYKLIEFADGTQEFYDLIADSLENNNLINTLTTEQSNVKTALETEAATIRSSWSCQDSIQNGDETGIDCGGSACAGCDGAAAPTYCSGDTTIITTEITEDMILYFKEYITSDQPLSADNATLQAGDSIVLKPGFEFSGANGTLSIKIATCEDSGINDANCSGDNSTSYTNIGCCAIPSTANVYSETVNNDIRSITTNNFPNHNYCYNSPSQQPSPVNYNLTMDATPTIANTTTSILSNTGRPQRYFGVALNGVIIAPAPAAPFIFTHTETGEYNWDWVFEPTNNQGDGQDKVGLDCASAHTGPQGYHYHGNPFQYVEGIQTDISTTSTPPANPIQIGWAGDGFPILYRFGPDENGDMKELLPSYTLKYGNRPGDGVSEPCGSYNGKYTNDYEYVSTAGDLDECNGITRTIKLTTEQGSETFAYFYVVTSAFPQISRCLVGTPDVSFGDLTDNDLATFFVADAPTDAVLGGDLEMTAADNETFGQSLDLQAMPNPTKGELFASFNGLTGVDYQLTILNYQGQQLQQSFIPSANQSERVATSFSISAYPTGMYILQLNDGKRTVVQKVLKN